MIQNLQEMVQILQHQGSCLDKKFGWVYPHVFGLGDGLAELRLLVGWPGGDSSCPLTTQTGMGFAGTGSFHSTPEDSILGRGQASSHHYCKQGAMGPLQYQVHHCCLV